MFTIKLAGTLIQVSPKHRRHEIGPIAYCLEMASADSSVAESSNPRLTAWCHSRLKKTASTTYVPLKTAVATVLPGEKKWAERRAEGNGTTVTPRSNRRFRKRSRLSDR